MTETAKIIYRPRYKPGVSGFKGVYYEANRKKNKWRAMIRIPGNGKNKTFHIGNFSTPEEASKAYIKKLNNNNERDIQNKA